MILHDGTLISEEILKAKFICDIEKCKGACCIEGDRGAPIEQDEIAQVSEQLHTILPYLGTEAKNWIAEHDFYERDPDGGFTTTCLPNGKCSFVIEESDGILSCGIEKAFRNNKTSFIKPISCHLYPIRIKQYAKYHALNYDRWEICNAACSLGEREGVRVYEFLMEPLIRKFGEDWYGELKSLADSYLSKQNS
jgi:hypothetical protein